MFTGPPTGSPTWSSGAGSVPPITPPAPSASPLESGPPVRAARRTSPLRIAVASLAVAMAAVGGGVVGASVEHAATSSGSGVATTAAVQSTPIDATGSMNVAQVLQSVGKSVVEISSDIVERTARGTQRGTSVGTGVIISADGQVLTNAHVVHGAQRVSVAIAGERAPRAGRVVASDPGADIALVQLQGPANLQPATLGNSDRVDVGDDVIAIGDALGLEGSPTVTRGIVSALNRNVDTENGTMTGMIQTDAAISSGNSGGPLVNSAGQVIGINTMVATSNENQAANNIGFAISINSAKSTLRQLAD